MYRIEKSQNCRTSRFNCWFVLVLWFSAGCETCWLIYIFQNLKFTFILAFIKTSSSLKVMQTLSLPRLASLLPARLVTVEHVMQHSDMDTYLLFSLSLGQIIILQFFSPNLKSGFSWIFISALLMCAMLLSVCQLRETRTIIYFKCFAFFISALLAWNP